MKIKQLGVRFVVSYHQSCETAVATYDVTGKSGTFIMETTEQSLVAVKSFAEKLDEIRFKKAQIAVEEANLIDGFEWEPEPAKP